MKHISIKGKWDQTHPRLFKLNRDTQYTDSHDTPNDGKDTDVVKDITVYHTGWLDTPRKINGKLRYYREREGGIDAATVVPFDGDIPPILQGVKTEG
ncbi:MAG: hypothetical protein JSV03_03595, partial [Planctomycetota bacterium]